MRSPYGLDIIENCIRCPYREERLFCNLSRDAVEDLQRIKSTSTYPKGALLFVEGQDSRGAFILCTGKAKLYTSSSEGRTIILRIVKPGEVLGLTSTIAHLPYEATVEILEPSQVNFLPKAEFLRFLTLHSDASMHVAKQLSSNCATAYEEIRCLGLSASSGEKLARLLLGWVTPGMREGGGASLKLSLTHQEIGEMIGASRETVTRLLADFRRHQLISIKGSTLLLRDIEALQRMITH